LARARAAVAAAKAAAEAARATLLARRGEAEGLARTAEARARRAAELARETERGQTRRAAAASHRHDLAARRAAAAAAAAAAKDLPAEVGRRAARLARALAEARARAERAGEGLAAAEAGLRAAAAAERAAERDAAQAREERAGAEAAATAATAAAAEAATRLRAEAGRAPGAPAPPDAPPPAPDALAAEVLRLRQARDGLGAVNLRAEEDLALARGEHDALGRERADLAQAVARLRGAIGALNREGRERLLAAFEQVNAAFAGLFAELFGGGEARLSLVESEDPLEAGLEILARPPGKTLVTISLLSGGEQTLTALALVFAVFLASPAPVAVLDEVDAPLDDANVARFCTVLGEIARRTGTRFLVITHHPVTMARMDRLFGVTMAEPGVSQLVSVDLGRAAARVA
ncbi:MAG: AAA family ATPase, partial [Rhodobacteraceae bacterium]|nr:AAA family ATPase [Paracoccaceae bacterium]